MSLVNLLQVNILDNPSTFFDNFKFEITFEVISELSEGLTTFVEPFLTFIDIEFKVVYVGSANGAEHDQILESVMVGPVPVGVSKFLLEAPAPNLELIPAHDIVGLTVMLLSCSYREKEFIRVGYYVNNDYVEEELRENPPAQPDLSKIQRSILAEKPRVTRFAIPWDQEEVVPIQQTLQEETFNTSGPATTEVSKLIDQDTSEIDAAMEA